jgi:Cu/Ag efflux protein CusF
MRTFAKWGCALAAIVMLASTATAGDALGVGKIKSINANKKTFVLTGDDKKEHTFALGENVVINRPDKEGKFDELKEGDRVSILYDKGVVTWTAEYILVHEGDFKKAGLARGAVKDVDTKNNKVVVTGLDNKDDTFEVKDDSKIELAGKPAKMDDLKLGEKATIVYTTDGKKQVIKQLIVAKK